MNTKDKLKATKTLKTTTIDLISKKTTLHVQHTFFLISKKKNSARAAVFFWYISLPLFYTTNVKLLLASYLRV